MSRRWIVPVVTVAAMAALLLYPSRKDTENPRTDEPPQEEVTKMPSVIGEPIIIPARGSTGRANVFVQTHANLEGHTPLSIACQGSIYRELEERYKAGALDGIFDEGPSSEYIMHEDFIESGLTEEKIRSYREAHRDDLELRTTIFNTDGSGAQQFAFDNISDGIHYQGWEPYTPEELIIQGQKLQRSGDLANEVIVLTDKLHRGEISADDPYFNQVSNEMAQLICGFVEQGRTRTRAGIEFSFGEAERRGLDDFAMVIGSLHERHLTEGQTTMYDIFDEMATRPEIHLYTCPRDQTDDPMVALAKTFCPNYLTGQSQLLMQ